MIDNLSDFMHPNLSAWVGKCQSRQKQDYDRSSHEPHFEFVGQVFVRSFQSAGPQWGAAIIVLASGPMSLMLNWLLLIGWHGLFIATSTMFKSELHQPPHPPLMSHQYFCLFRNLLLRCLSPNALQPRAQSCKWICTIWSDSHAQWQVTTVTFI